MTDGCRAIWYKTSPCFLCFLFSLSLAFSSESVSKTCRIWYAFFFLSQVRNTCLCSCIILSEQLQCFLQSPTLDYHIFADQPRSSQEIEAVTLGFLSSELTFSSQWIGRGEITTSCWQLNYYHWYTHTTTSTFSFLYSLPQKYEHIHKISFTTSVSNILTIASNVYFPQSVLH